jgi:hypothetical protein
MFIDNLNKFEDNQPNNSIVRCMLLSKILDLFLYLKENIHNFKVQQKQKQKQKPNVVYKSFKRIHLNKLEGNWYVLIPDTKRKK